jgi:hypothetical protein
MNALLNKLHRLGFGAEPVIETDNDDTAALLQKAAAAVEAAQARIEELTQALQGLVDLSDSSRPREYMEAHRRLVQARRVLAVGQTLPRELPIIESAIQNSVPQADLQPG